MPKLPQNPEVRLALTHDGMPSKNKRYDKALPNPEVRLAHVPGMQGDNVLMGRNGIEVNYDLTQPALLISYVYLEKFLENQHRYAYRNWMMDSGAYSAYTCGQVINIDEYIATCHKLWEEDNTLVEIIALDVIGDGKGSLKNATYMRDKGVNCIPVFHIGDDWGILKEYCAGWDKVGISCRFGEKIEKSCWFYDQCFARSWPKKFHSFGWMDDNVMMRYPLHSGDSSSWELQPCAFGHWKVFGNLRIRGSNQNLRPQIDYYLDLEEKLRLKWAKEMTQLEGIAKVSSPTVRLVAGTGRSARDGSKTGLEK